MDTRIFLTLLKTIIALIGIIVAANIFLRYLNSKTKTHKGSINIIDKLQVTNTSNLAIVEILGTHYLMSISESKSDILKELSECEISTVYKKINERNSNKGLNIGKGIGCNFIKYQKKVDEDE